MVRYSTTIYNATTRQSITLRIQSQQDVRVSVLTTAKYLIRREMFFSISTLPDRRRFLVATLGFLYVQEIYNEITWVCLTDCRLASPILLKYC